MWPAKLIFGVVIYAMHDLSNNADIFGFVFSGVCAITGLTVSPFFEVCATCYTDTRLDPPPPPIRRDCDQSGRAKDHPHSTAVRQCQVYGTNLRSEATRQGQTDNRIGSGHAVRWTSSAAHARISRNFRCVRSRRRRVAGRLTLSVLLVVRCLLLDCHVHVHAIGHNNSHRSQLSPSITGHVRHAWLGMIERWPYVWLMSGVMIIGANYRVGPVWDWWTERAAIHISAFCLSRGSWQSVRWTVSGSSARTFCACWYVCQVASILFGIQLFSGGKTLAMQTHR